MKLDIHTVLFVFIKVFRLVSGSHSDGLALTIIVVR